MKVLCLELEDCPYEHDCIHAKPHIQKLHIEDDYYCGCGSDSNCPACEVIPSENKGSDYSGPGPDLEEEEKQENALPEELFDI